ncbi:MAG: hypothetical protein WAW59_04725 [Patescibacteria group bacterium]
MRYILALLVSALFIALGFQLVPVGAVTSTVSGETRAKVSSSQIKKVTLERKIKVMKAEIAKTEIAIKFAQKRLDALKAAGKNTNLAQKRLDILLKKKTTQQELLDTLLRELALIK